VFDTSSDKSSPIELLKGHTSSSFAVAWNNSFEYLLASTSNDKTVRVWNLNDVIF